MHNPFGHRKGSCLVEGFARIKPGLRCGSEGVGEISAIDNEV